MKTLTNLSIVFLILFSMVSCNSEKIKSQKESDKNESDSLKNITKLEKFLTKKGELFIKDFYKVGTIQSNTNLSGSMDIDAVVIYNPGREENRIKGLKIEMKQTRYTGYSSYDDDATVFLDMDELKGLSDAIKYMSDLIAKWKSVPKEYTEVIYSTTGQFRLGFFKQTKSDKTDNIWGFAEGGFNKVSCYFNGDIVKELNQVKDKIDDGIKILNSR